VDAMTDQLDAREAELRDRWQSVIRPQNQSLQKKLIELAEQARDCVEPVEV